MSSESIWKGTAADPSWSALSGDVTADVAVVGGGITGITTALLLAEAGRSVALLEAGRMGCGDTGASTGNLYQTVSGGLGALRGKWGPEVARDVASSRGLAIDFIEQRCAALGAGAAFRRCRMLQYAGSPDAVDAVAAECDAAREAGLAVHVEKGLPAGVPSTVGDVLVMENQAQFHPLAYVQGLAAQAARMGVRIHERSAVVEVDHDRRTVTTAAGSALARDIVLATHSPSGFHLVQAAMTPGREYGLAFPVAPGGVPPGIFWAQGSERLSVRGLDTAAGSFLLCIGIHHTTGQHDTEQAMAELEQRVQRRLGLSDAAFRWSGQHFHSADGLPYIGQDASGAFIATGFATDGLVYGTLAAQIICDQLLRRNNRWSALYRPGRFDPVKAGKGVFEENLGVVKALVKDYVTAREHGVLAELQAGQGAIVQIDGERLAAYRDPAGALHVVSPVCTHMKCLVHWNALETSWDCPCHGSRFAPDGRVLEGPALRPLPRKSMHGSS